MKLLFNFSVEILLEKRYPTLRGFGLNVNKVYWVYLCVFVYLYCGLSKYYAKSNYFVLFNYVAYFSKNNLKWSSGKRKSVSFKKSKIKITSFSN